ncbi:MAG: IS110 family transposase, partial [Methylocella sp.]
LYTSRGLERSRDLLVKQHTQLLNCVRSQLAEQGIVAAQGRRGFAELTALLVSGDARVPEVLLEALRMLLAQAEALRTAMAALEKKILAIARENETMRRLATIPGVGGLTAHAIAAAIGEGKQFGSARDFAAWCGLTPKEHSSAGKRRGRGISHQGDNRLRKLFALGASTMMRNARSRSDRATEWQRGILARRPMKVAVLAQAAKTARIAWAVLVSGESFRPRLSANRSLGSRRHRGARSRAVCGLNSFWPERVRPESKQGAKHSDGKRSGPGLGNSAPSSRLKSAPQCLEPDPRYPSGPAVIRPRQQAEYMTAPDQLPQPIKVPCQTGTVHT